jgi:hypothetical protein
MRWCTVTVHRLSLVIYTTCRYHDDIYFRIKYHARLYLTLLCPERVVGRPLGEQCKAIMNSTVHLNPFKQGFD